MSDATRAVVVTGASTGIGFATAKVLAERGLRVFGSVRREADAARLRSEIGERFEPLVFDVTDEAALRAGAGHVRSRLGGETLLGLVNNAGIAVGGPLLHIPLSEMRRQFEVNLFGVLAVTQAFAPLLGAEPSLRGAPGRIVNMSSVGGGIAVPLLGPYVSSKHALEALSDSLRRELMIHGIDVIVVGPGSVRTPIWDKAEQIDVERYANTPYGEALRRFRDQAVATGRVGLAPEDVGRLIHEILSIPRPKARYPLLRHRFTGWTLPRLLPKRFLDRLIAKRLGLERRR